MKVIFLDVDGVLNDQYTDEKTPVGFIGLEERMVKNLQHVVNETNATIILVSSWKSYWDKNPEKMSRDGQYLTDELARFGLTIADKTVDHIDNRGHGIVSYLQEHPEIEQWIVLDDDVFYDYEECGIIPHLVQTSFYRDGLSDILAQKAIDMLSDREITL